MSAEVEALQSRIRELCGLVRKVHAAKGRHHTQLAMCDLFDSVGLENVRPVSPAKQYADADCAKSEARWTDVVSTGATDPLYDQALELVRKLGRGSISYVQRHLRIGYNRAAYMVEAMEKAGIITPWGPGGSGRDVVPVVDRKRPDDTEGGLP